MQSIVVSYSTKPFGSRVRTFVFNGELWLVVRDTHKQRVTSTVNVSLSVTCTISEAFSNPAHITSTYDKSRPAGSLPRSTSPTAKMAADQDEFLRTGLRTITGDDAPPTESECTICLRELRLGQEINQIRTCGHAFHKPCLLSWLNSRNNQHSSCPNCRQELFPTRHPAHSRSAESIAAMTREVVALRDRFHRLELAREERLRGNPVPAPSSNPQASRTTRVAAGLDPVPACITPDPTTGEYVTVESRFRSFYHGALREGGADAATVARMVENLWISRHAFVRDIERLEYLYSRLGPLHVRQVLGPLLPGSVADDTPLAQLCVEFDDLLNKLMPHEVHRGINTSIAGLGLDTNLRIHARKFSLLSPAEEERAKQSAEDTWSRMAVMYTAEQRSALVEGLVARHRTTRFVDSGVHRHYVGVGEQPLLQVATDARIEEPMTDRLGAGSIALGTPNRTPRYQNSSSIRPGLGGSLLDAPSTTSSWQPGRSPFRSPAHEAMSMGVSWADGSPRGANLNLLDPEYLRWREEQGRPSLANSPISMAVGGRYRTRNENESHEGPTNYMDDYRFGGTAVRSPSAQGGRRERQNEMERPPPSFATAASPTLSGLNTRTSALVSRPSEANELLRPEEMSERRSIHEAFFSELQRLQLGPEAQMESVRLFPRQAIYDRSVQSDAIAQCAFMVRVLQNARQATTMSPTPASESRDLYNSNDDSATEKAGETI
jgi:hypothetical protein